MNNSSSRPRRAERASTRVSAWTLALAAAFTLPVALPAKANQAPDHIPGRILVQFHPNATVHQMRTLTFAAHATDKGEIPHTGVHIIELPHSANEVAVADAFSKRPEVRSAELDMIIAPAQGTVTPNDTYYSSEWHLKKIAAPTAWSTTTGNGNVIIAILDSGCDPNHPDLVGKYVPGWNIYDNNNNTSDATGHGTSVAGAAAASSNNSTGVTSVAWGCKIMPVRITDSTGATSCSVIATAITWAADNGALVANVSYGGADMYTAVRNAATYLASKGGVTTCSAGNSGTVQNYSACDSILNVSATDQSDKLCSWSCYGTPVAVSAPGTGICTTTKGGGYSTSSWGTSFSAPIVAGIAALLISANPNLTGQQVHDFIEQSADDLGTPGWDSQYGYGRVNAAKALALALGGTTDITPPTVSITSPTSGTNVWGLCSVQVSASDNVGVASVTLSIDGTSVKTFTAAPYTYSLDTTTYANGNHTIQAVATDAAGNSANASTTVTVANSTLDTSPPTVSITSPSGGANVQGAVSVSVNATDNVGVTSVALYVDNVLVATDTASPYNFTWDSTKAANGTHSIQAVGSDAAGNTSTATVSVTVSNATADITPPTISITSPAPGAILGNLTVVSVNATDNVGVVKVELYADGALKGTSTSAPFSVSWNTRKLTKGSHTIFCKAYDAAGNVGSSPTIMVTK